MCPTTDDPRAINMGFYFLRIAFHLTLDKRKNIRVIVKKKIPIFLCKTLFFVYLLI